MKTDTLVSPSRHDSIAGGVAMWQTDQQLRNDFAGLVSRVPPSPLLDSSGHEIRISNVATWMLDRGDAEEGCREEPMASKCVTAFIGIIAFLACVFTAEADQSSDPRIADLVQSGRLRVALGLGSPALAIKDPKSGELRGPALDLARALATKIGVRLESVEYPRPGAVLQGIKNDEWDVTFLVADPARAAEADFSPPYMQTDYTYLLAAGSSKHSVADIDQAGVRIAVPRGDGSDLRLTRMLKHAELVRADSVAAIIEMVRAGRVEAYAGPRVVLLKLSEQVPASRVLDGGFADIVYVAMVPKGKVGRIAYVSDFIEEAKSSGLVRRIIDRYGLRGIEVSGAKSSGADHSRH